MQYMLLIYDEERVLASMSDAERDSFMQEYFVYTQSLRDSGAFVNGDALQPTATATTVTVRDGETITTDGPFAETKEQLGGFYILDCGSMEEAVELASKIPSATYGSIEVRPVMDYEAAGSTAHSNEAEAAR